MQMMLNASGLLLNGVKNCNCCIRVYIELFCGNHCLTQIANHGNDVHNELDECSKCKYLWSYCG